jgi:hypothetical protein
VPADRAADQHGVERGVREPEIALRLDGADDRADALARIGQKFEHAREHAVVAQQVFFGDRLPQRHDLVAVVTRQVEPRAIGVVRLAHLRAGLDRNLRRPIERSQIGGIGLGATCVAGIEQRQRKLEFQATLHRFTRLRVARHAKVHTVDPARDTRQAVSPGGRLQR